MMMAQSTEMSGSHFSSALRGAAALYDALALIGAEGADDRALAKVIVENEPEIRDLLNFGIARLTDEKRWQK